MSTTVPQNQAQQATSNTPGAPNTPTEPQRINTIPPVRSDTSQVTQASYKNDLIRIPEIITRTVFSSETVKRLTSDDFDINSKDMITLKAEDCILILFYIENEESQQLASVWAIVAQQIAGPLFGAVNMLNERKLAQAFTKIRGLQNHPLHPYSLKGYPFILVYRGGYPVGVYNGARDVQSIIDFSLTLACSSSYNEPFNYFAGAQSEYPIEMTAPQPYPSNDKLNPKPLRTSSLQYQTGTPVRGYNPNEKLSMTGSTQSNRNLEEENRRTLEGISSQPQNERQPVTPQ